MSAATLHDALAAAGLTFTVEERGRLALLVAPNGEAPDAKGRRAIVAMARAHGFANVCIELGAVDAALSGD